MGPHGPIIVGLRPRRGLSLSEMERYPFRLRSNLRIAPLLFDVAAPPNKRAPNTKDSAYQIHIQLLVAPDYGVTVAHRMRDNYLQLLVKPFARWICDILLRLHLRLDAVTSGAIRLQDYREDYIRLERSHLHQWYKI